VSGGTVRLSGVNAPAFRISIPCILARGAKEEMERIDTSGLVAFVADIHTCRDCSPRRLVCESVRANIVRRQTEATISPSVYRAPKIPTGRG